MGIKLLKYYIVFTLMVMVFTPSLGQRKIRLEPGSSHLQMFKKDGISYTSVIGNVKFTHKGTVFLCDWFGQVLSGDDEEGDPGADQDDERQNGEQPGTIQEPAHISRG